MVVDGSGHVLHILRGRDVEVRTVTLELGRTVR